MAATTSPTPTASAEPAEKPADSKSPANRSPSVAPEKAPDNTPTSVIPICTDDRNLPGSEASARARREPDTPRSTSACRRERREETTASSAIASRPLMQISAATIASSRKSIPEYSDGHGRCQGGKTSGTSEAASRRALASTPLARASVGIGAIVGRQPSRERGRSTTRRLELAQRHANVRACETLILDGDHRRVLSGGHVRGYPLLEQHEFGVAEHVQQVLEGVVTDVIELPGLPKRILRGVSRIKVRARNPAIGNLLGCGMGAAVVQQIGQDMGVGSDRTLAVGIGYRLIDLDPPHATEKHAMGARSDNHAHRRIVGFGQRAPLLLA